LEAIDAVDLVTGYRCSQRVPLWFRIPETMYRLFLRIVLGIPTERRPCWLGRSGWRRRWLARWALSVLVDDPECAFRLYRRALFERIPIQSNGSFAHIEIMAKANFMGAMLTQVPVAYQAPTDGIPPYGLEDASRSEIAAVLSNPQFLPPVPEPRGELPPTIEYTPPEGGNGPAPSSSTPAGGES
jgi:hypothetical protein